MRYGKSHFDAIDAQLLLLDEWYSSKGVDQARSFLESQAQNRGPVVYTPSDEEREAGVLPEWVMTKAIYYGLNKASTYWVNKEFVTIASDAAKTMPEAPITPVDIPTQGGFALLEDPIYMRDMNDRLCNVKAVMWMPNYFKFKVKQGGMASAQGMAITLFSDPSDPADEGWGKMSADRRKTLFGRRLILLAHMGLFWKDPKLTGAQIMVYVNNKGDHSHIDGDFFGGNFPAYPRDPDLQIVVPGQEKNTAIDFLLALWRLSTQKVFVVSKRPLDRPIRREIHRSRHAPEWGEVRTIDLRRHVYGGDRGRLTEEEAEQHWGHRWLVSGHWAHRWANDGAGGKILRPVFVLPHLKGPAGLPLVLKQDVRRVDR